MQKSIKGSFRWRKNALHIDYRKKVDGKSVRVREAFGMATTGTQKERRGLEKKALAKLESIMAEQDNSKFFDNSQTETNFPTYEQIAHFYWDTKGATKEGFEKGYHASPDFGKLKKSIAYFGDMPSNKITRLDVKEYRKTLSQIKHFRTGKPLKNSYINRLIAIIGQVYSHCISQEEFMYKNLSDFEKEKYGNIDILVHLENPRIGLQNRTEERNPPYVPTREEFVRFWKELKPAIQYIAITGIHTGLRKKNVVKLKWEHVDIFKGYIIVPTHKGSKNGPPLIHKMADELHCMMKLLSKYKGENVYVHVKSNGEPYSDFSRAWNTAIKKAEVSRFTFKGLRTTYATWTVERGVAMPLLQKSLGHSTSQPTSEFYNESKIATDIIAKDQPALLPTGTFG